MDEIKAIFDRIKMHVFGTTYTVRLAEVQEGSEHLLFFLIYESPDSTTGLPCQWSSPYYYVRVGTEEDEVIKTVYQAFQTAVIHEAQEGFKVDGDMIFNPHAAVWALKGASKFESKQIIK